MSRTNTRRLGTSLPFCKMHGLGNDFIIIDARADAIFSGKSMMNPQLATALADRNTGIGADLIAVILEAKTNDVAARVEFWNADGSSAESCGNATRCITRLLSEEAIDGKLRLETAGGVRHCQLTEDGQFLVDMGAPKLSWQDIPLSGSQDTTKIDVELAPKSRPALGKASAVNMGNPHAIFFVEDIGKVPVSKLGSLIENHPMFPKGANVGFAQILTRDRVSLRVWERGIGETRACGSGACAALVAAVRRDLTDRQATIELIGGDLSISWCERDDHVLMKGPASMVYNGVVAPDFSY